MTNDAWYGRSVWKPIMDWFYRYADALDYRESDVLRDQLGELERRLTKLEHRDQRQGDG